VRAENPPWPRFTATLALGFLLTVLGSTLFAWWAAGPLRLQPVVVVVVSAGFRLPLGAGGLAAGLLGYLADVLSGGINGLQLTAYMLVLCLGALAERKLEIFSWPLQMLSVGLASLVFQLTVLGGLMLTHLGHLAPANLWLVLVLQALLNSLTAPIFFTVLEAFVRLAERLWPKGQQAAG
jgi:rod shape-determining protein MreD